MNRSVLASKHPGDDVRAILEELAGSAVRDAAALPDRAEERIHDIRVGMKEFRAVVRLASPVLSSRELTRLDKLARDVKDAFGAARDHAVQLGLLRELVGHHGAKEAEAALPAAAASLPDVADARKTCEKLSVMTRKLDLRKMTHRHIIACWSTSYREARRAMAACADGGEDDFLFHQWRKRVKVVLYQCGVLGPPVDSLVPGARELASVLGSQHDLAVLCEKIHFCGPDAERLAFEKKRKTSSLALALGQRLFRKKPSAFLKNAHE